MMRRTGRRATTPSSATEIPAYSPTREKMIDWAVTGLPPRLIAAELTMTSPIQSNASEHAMMTCHGLSTAEDIGREGGTAGNRGNRARGAGWPGSPSEVFRLYRPLLA